MRLRIYYCPACGYSLKIEQGTTSVICPACGNTVMVEPEQEEHETQNRSHHTTTITDAGSGQVIASAMVPEGWKTVGEIRQVIQSLSNPFTAQVQVTSPDGETVLFANTGESFQQLKKAPMRRHQEGVFNQSTKMPMRNFVMPGVYLDGIAKNMAMGKNISVLDTKPLPSVLGQNIQAAKQEGLREAESLERNALASGIQLKFQNVFTGALMKAYRIGEQVLILGADMSGMEYAMYAPGMGMMPGFGTGFMQGAEMLANVLNPGFSGKMNGSPDDYKGVVGFFRGGGLIGAMMRKKNRERTAPQNTSQQGNAAGSQSASNQQDEGQNEFGRAPIPGATYGFADWGSKAVYGMITSFPLTDHSKKIFQQFVSTFLFDPSIQARMKAMTEEMGRAGVQQQQQWFAAQQQAYHTRQEAYDRQNQAWWDRQNQAYEHQRNAWQSQMDAQDRMSEKWAEVNRGENIYVRPDGSETTYSNSADRMFMKDGDPQTMRSASKGEDVPYGWSELKKKY